MAASGCLGTKAVIAFDIGLGFEAQDQSSWCVDIRAADSLAVHQSMQKIQHVGLRGDTLSQGHLASDQHGLLVVMQHQGQDIDHPLAGRRCLHRR